MKPSIVLYKSIPTDLHQRLAQHFTVNSFDGLTPDNQPELLAALQQAEGLIGSGGKIDQDFFTISAKFTGCLHHFCRL